MSLKATVSKNLLKALSKDLLSQRIWGEEFSALLSIILGATLPGRLEVSRLSEQRLQKTCGDGTEFLYTPPLVLPYVNLFHYHGTLVISKLVPEFSEIIPVACALIFLINIITK